MRVHRSYIVALDKIEQIERINRLSIIRESIFPKRTAMISENLWMIINFCNHHFQSFFSLISTLFLNKMFSVEISMETFSLLPFRISLQLYLKLKNALKNYRS